MEISKLMSPWFSSIRILPLKFQLLQLSEISSSVFSDYLNLHFLLRCCSVMLNIFKCPWRKSQVNVELTECFPSFKDSLSSKHCLCVLLFNALLFIFCKIFLLQVLLQILMVRSLSKSSLVRTKFLFLVIILNISEILFKFSFLLTVFSIALWLDNIQFTGYISLDKIKLLFLWVKCS